MQKLLFFRAKCYYNNMIHSMGGGVIREYENLIYCFVQIESGTERGVKRWFISPYITVAAGDRVEVPCGRVSAEGKVLRVENVTAQTAPFPVKRTAEIICIIG